MVLGCTITPVADISFLYSSKEIEDGFNIAGYSREAVDSYLELIIKENDYTGKKRFYKFKYNKSRCSIFGFILL